MCMEQPLVSIIVPVYNVEKYLERCVDSILSQSYRNIELILVDDGSPDRCGMICDEYREKDGRIQVIHKKNGGLSSARNAGLDIIKGEYVSFVDSDDFIHIDCISKMLELVKEYHADACQCNFEKGNKNCFTMSIKSPKVYYSEAAMFIGGRKVKITAWGKLYRTKLFESVRFPIGKINEDEYTTYKVLAFAKRFVLTTEPLYYYYNNPDSIMRRKKDRQPLEYIEAYKERVSFFANRKERELEGISHKEFAIRLLLSYISYKDYEKSDLTKRELFELFQIEYALGRKYADRVIEKTALDLFHFLPGVTSIILKKVYNGRH